jgi:hypothetical protein
MMPQGIFPFQYENEQKVNVAEMEIAWKTGWKKLLAAVGGVMVEYVRSFVVHSG